MTGQSAFAHQALAIARRSGFGLLEGQALTVLAEIHQVRNETELAESFGAEALAAHRRSGHRLNEARTLVVLGYKDSALWREALDIFEELGVPEADELRRRVEGEAGR